MEPTPIRDVVAEVLLDLRRRQRMRELLEMDMDEDDMEAVVQHILGE